MNKKTRVLIFPCGSVMAAEIYQALRYSAHVELFGASSVDDYGRFLFERYTGGLPYISDNEFDEAFAAVIKRLNIEMVFAPHDSIINHLAPKAQAMGFFLVNGDPTTAAIVRKKSATYSLFSDCDWTPETYKSLPEVQDWPIIIKPDIGQGGCDVFLVRNLNEASLAVGRIANPVFLEYLPGGEVTVDCFSDRNRKLIWVGPRSRVRVRGGVAMRTNTLELSREIEFIASEINSRLNLRGPWYFQLKAGLKGKWKLLEIACRIGGATAAQRARGINLPLMAVQDYLGRDLIVAHNPQVNCIERNISSRATLDFDFDTIFIDLDGALIINGFAVPQVLFFLYQSYREGKVIKLFSRYEHDITKILKKARVARELFDEVIHLRAGAFIADYVTKKSILIDSRFHERSDVAAKCGIPVLDVDALEFFVR